MHLPKRSFQGSRITMGVSDERDDEVDTSPQYHRRQTPEEIQEMLGSTGPCPAADYYDGGVPTQLPEYLPITEGEIRKRIAAGEKGWGAPLNEISELNAHTAHAEANAALAKSTAGTPGCVGKDLDSMPPVNQHVPGAKSDHGKLDLTLVPVEMEEAVAEIMTFGARKYTRDGWRSVPDAGLRYFAAMERHLKSFRKGEDNDPESGLHHLAHAACNLAFLLHFLRNGKAVGSWRHTGETNG